MSDKFKFVDEEDITDKSVEKTEDNNEINTNVTKKFYFSFEARIVVSVLVILFLFASACFLGLKVINHTTIEKIRYEENSDVNYYANLEDSKCVSSDYEFKASEIKDIKLDFGYYARYKSEVVIINSYKITAIVREYSKKDHSLLSEKKTTLVNQKKFNKYSIDTVNASEIVSIDYQSYKMMVKDSKNVDAQVEVALYVMEGNKTRKVSGINIPLTKDSFELKSFSTTNTVREIRNKVNIWDTYSLIYVVATSILVLVSLVLIFKTTRLVLKVTNTKSEYEEALESLLKEYDSIITVAGEGFESIVPEEKEVIKFDSFEELAKVREEVNKPIIYSKINNVKCEFVLEDDKALYKYVMKEADFTEEDKNKLENK